MLRKTCVPITVGAGAQEPLAEPLTHAATEPQAAPFTDLSRVHLLAFEEFHDRVNAAPATVVADDWPIEATGTGAAGGMVIVCLTVLIVEVPPMPLQTTPKSCDPRMVFPGWQVPLVADPFAHSDTDARTPSLIDRVSEHEEAPFDDH